MRTIGIINEKGGTGKTTTARETAAALAAKGGRVAALDLDWQGDLSRFLLDEADPVVTIAEAIEGARKATDAATRTEREGLDVLAADARLLALAKQPYTVAKARDVLAQLAERYDWAVIDFPRSSSPLAVAFLALCDVAVIPTEASRASFERTAGVVRLIGTIKEPPIAAILITRFNGRTRIARDYAQLVEDFAEETGTTLIGTRIPQAAAVQESEGYGLTLEELKPKSKPAIAYRSFIEELLTLA